MARAPSAHALHVARYAPQCGSWRSGRFQIFPRQHRLRVVTWNILCAEHRWRVRLSALFAELEPLRPDLIALQEVTPHQLEHILALDWVRDHFATSDMDGGSLEPSGVLLLSRPALLEARSVPLPSRRGRRLLLARVETGCGPLALAVAHLESGSRARATRLRQLSIVQQALPGGLPALIAGDLNFDADADPEDACLPADLVDCWRRLHPAEAGKTLDPAANALRAALVRDADKHSRALRCDRLLLRPGAAARWQPLESRRLGMAAPRDGADAFASDHFGLLATIACGHASSGHLIRSGEASAACREPLLLAWLPASTAGTTPGSTAALDTEKP